MQNKEYVMLFSLKFKIYHKLSFGISSINKVLFSNQYFVYELPVH